MKSDWPNRDPRQNVEFLLDSHGEGTPLMDAAYDLWSFITHLSELQCHWSNELLQR